MSIEEFEDRILGYYNLTYQTECKNNTDAMKLAFNSYRLGLIENRLKRLRTLRSQLKKESKKLREKYVNERVIKIKDEVFKNDS
jgi:hypothetical protein